MPSLGSSPQTGRETQLVETRPGVGSVHSAPQPAQGRTTHVPNARTRAVRWQAGQAQAAVPSLTVRETTVRSYNPWPSREEQVKVGAAAGRPQEITETTIRTIDSTSAGPTLPQTETSEPSLDILWRTVEMQRRAAEAEINQGSGPSTRSLAVERTPGPSSSAGGRRPAVHRADPRPGDQVSDRR